MPPSGAGSVVAPLTAFCALAIVFLSVLAWGWLPQAPSGEELAGYAGKFRHFAQWLEDGVSWWVPGYLSGFSAAALWSYAAAMPPYLAAMLFFEPHTAVKVTGLALLGLGGLTAFAFGLRLTRSGWTAFAIGTAWLLAPQVLGRVGWLEHMTLAVAVLFVPVTFWALLRVSENGGWIDAQLLAMAFAATVLVSNKIGATLLFPLGVFAVWLFVSRPGERIHLIRGFVRAAPMALLLGFIPLLPMVREAGLMTVFETGPFAAWQAGYSVVTGMSWLDRGGALFAELPWRFSVNRGGYYLGMAGMLALAAVVARTWNAPRPAREEPPAGLRVFAGITLMVFWLSHGSRSVLAGHFEFLEASAELADWWIPVHWLLLAGQGALFFWLLPAMRWRVPAFLALFAVYLLVPGFRLVERLPFFGDLRAPDSFWILGGTFAWCVAAGIAVAACLGAIPSRVPRVLAGLAALGFVLWDFSPYAARFHDGGLAPELFADYREAEEFIAESDLSGRVLPVSGRYFYLALPANTGRGLVTEAAHHNFKPAHAARLEATASASAETFLTWLNLTGVSHVLVDLSCPDTHTEYVEWLRVLLPTVFENPHFLVLGNPDFLAPASIWQRAAETEDGDRGYAAALRLARDGVLMVPNAGNATALGAGVVAGGNVRRMESAGTGRSDTVAFDPAGRSGWLVLSVPWHPDWAVFVDGKRVEAARAAGAFPAVRLTGAETEIVFRFTPPAWYPVCLFAGAAGWTAALLWLCALPFVPAGMRRAWTKPLSSRPYYPVDSDGGPIMRPL